MNDEEDEPATTEGIQMSVTKLQKCKMNRVSVGVGVDDSEWKIKTTSLRRKVCKGV